MKLAIIIFILNSIFVGKIMGQTYQVKVNINDSTYIILEKIDFDTTEKKIEYFENFLVAINGRPIFGTDGDLPKFTLIKATLTIGKNEYDLQVDDMYNPWFGNGINDRLFKIKKEGNRYQLTGIFSDGAGSYGAEWLIVGKLSIRTILTNDEWIFEYIHDEL